MNSFDDTNSDTGHPTFSNEAEAFLEKYDAGPQVVDPALYLADSIIVGDLNGSRAMSREEFVSGITARGAAMTTALPKRLGFSVMPLSARYGVITGSWEITLGDAPESPRLTLHSDFVVERTGEVPRCIAYLTRQNIRDEIVRIMSIQN